MNINPPTYPAGHYKCFFCGSFLDFLLNESMEEGLQFFCFNCQRNYKITKHKGGELNERL